MIWLISGSRFAPEREVKAILDTMADAGWLYIGFARPLDRGRGAYAVALIAGADADVPWRPWPTLWAERRGIGGSHVLITLVCCGVGVMVQTGMRSDA